MGNCLPKKEDLETSIVKDFDEPAVPEPSQVHIDLEEDEEKKIQDEASCCVPSNAAPSDDDMAQVTQDDETVAAASKSVEPAPVETVVIEETRPKSFMEKVDAFRDACCGVGLIATSADSTKEDVKSSVVEEAHVESKPVPVVAEDEPVALVDEEMKELLVDDEVTEEAAPVVPTAPVANTAAATTTNNGNPFRSPNFKQRRKLKKKLREITSIEEKQAKGDELTQDQSDKLACKADILAELNAI